MDHGKGSRAKGEMPVKNTVHHVLHAFSSEQGGANIYVILAICFGLLLVTPFFLNALSLYVVRRTSVTGADAAALAAAEAYAEALTFVPNKPGHYEQWTPKSPCTRWFARMNDPVDLWASYESLLEYAADWYEKLKVNRELGLAYATDYAKKNRTDLVNYSTGVTNDPTSARIVMSKLGKRGFQAITVSVLTQRSYVPAVPGYSSNDELEVPAGATAEIYMENHAGPKVRFCNPKCNYTIERCWIYYEYEFLWQIRLRKYEGR